MLVRDFKAKYVVVLKSDQPAHRYFETDVRFQRELETKREAVYRVVWRPVVSMHPGGETRASGS